MNDSAEFHYIGKSVPRLEDARLLTGHGAFVDDVTLPDMAAMAILRSPHAHARILSIDFTAARALPGVLDIFAADEMGPDLPRIPLRLAPFPGFERMLQAPIAAGKVRYVGEPVAVVVAENRYLAEDALEEIIVEYDPLPAVTSVDQSAAGDVLLFEEAGENMGTRYRVGRGDIDVAFADASYTRRERFVSNRHAACPMETRGLIADYDETAPRLRLIGAAKVTYYNRRHLAEAFGLDPDRIELIEQDVGGGFGARGELYPEDYLVPIASRRTGRPVKWIEDRRENLMACNHSRDVVCDLEIAATRDGKILGMRAIVQGDMGAYIRTNGGVVPSKTVQFLPGPYRVPAFEAEMQALVTNKTPVGTYRGPGRVEANFCRERLIDMMAGDLGIDPVEIRLANLRTPEELPYRMGELVPNDPNATLDDGDYPSAFRRLLEEIDYPALKARQGVVTDGKTFGLGFACFVESSAAGPPETARIGIAEGGKIEIRIGASSVGQGVETGMAQICAENLGIPLEGITVLHGSTTLLDAGGGTFNSRNTVMAGNAVRMAAENLRRNCEEQAALRWNVAVDAVAFENGGVRHGDAFLSLAGIAAFAGPLSADATYANGGRVSYSYGAHAALVAVDLATGGVEIERYVLTEEIGRALNPAMVESQAVGGVVQGIGGALLEHMTYDENGQFLSGSFADYLLPTAAEAPPITAITLEDAPSKMNPMGFKGAGEGGIVAVAAAIANAVAQATGAKITELPLSPDRLRAYCKTN
jgi:aerobic carbon-monoxide dehydrogenase large subunit